MGRFIDITGAPIVSDFQEMPLDFMAKALSAKQAAYDKQDLEAAGVPGLIPEGFIATKGYKDELMKELNPKLAEWSKRAIADPEGVGRDITKYKAQLSNDIRYKKLAEDTALKAGYLEKIAKLNESGVPYEKAFDYVTGQYKGPVDSKKLVAGEVTGNLQEFYGNPFYGDPNKEMREVFSTIKPITSQNAHEYMAGVTDFGDQLKRGESVEMSSSTLDDPRIIFYTGEGKNKRGVTLGELTQKKFNDAYGTWLAGNTVGAQYYQTELSPALKVNLGLSPDATLSDKQAAYAQRVYNPMAVYTDKRSSDFATFGSNALDAANKKLELSRIPVPGLTIDYSDPSAFINSLKSTYATKTSSAQAVADLLRKAGKIKGSPTEQLKLALEYSKPENVQKLLNDANAALANKNTSSEDYLLNRDLKTNLLAALDAQEEEGKLRDKLTKHVIDGFKALDAAGIGRPAVEQQSILKGIRNTSTNLGDVLDNAMKLGIVDTESINKLLQETTSSDIVPIYSVRTGKGEKTGMYNTVETTILENWGNNMDVFEGQDSGLSPSEWIKSQFPTSDEKSKFDITNISLDKNKNVIVSMTDGQAHKNFRFKDSGDKLNYHKGEFINDLRKTNDPQAHTFANIVSFKDELKNNGQQGKWSQLIQAQPDPGKSTTVTLDFQGTDGPVKVPVIKKTSAYGYTTYIYQYKDRKTNTTKTIEKESADDIENLLGQLIKH